MFTKLTNPPKKVASHVVRNRARYAATAGFITGMYCMRQFDANTYGEAMTFLEEKGLKNEFFALTDEV